MGFPDHSAPSRPSVDAEIAARLRDGDVVAYTTVFRAYYLPVVRFLTKYLRRDDAAEDVAQDVFLRLWERREEIDPSRSLKAYLFTSARHRLLNLLKHDQVEQQYAEETVQAFEDLGETSSELQPDEAIVVSELARIAEARVAMLSPRLREVYHLSREEGLSAAEIGEVLGTSVHTVYAQLAKIAQALHPVLRRWMDE